MMLNYMGDAPSIIPHIYFHGNCSRQRVHNNAIGYSKLLATKHYHSTPHIHCQQLHIAISDEQEPACCTCAAMTESSGKFCACSPCFINLNTWKSEGSKSRLYDGCGRVVQPNFEQCSMVFKLVWGLVLLCCRRRFVSFLV